MTSVIAVSANQNLHWSYQFNSQAICGLLKANFVQLPGKFHSLQWIGLTGIVNAGSIMNVGGKSLEGPVRERQHCSDGKRVKERGRETHREWEKWGKSKTLCTGCWPFMGSGFASGSWFCIKRWNIFWHLNHLQIYSKMQTHSGIKKILSLWMCNLNNSHFVLKHGMKMKHHNCNGLFSQECDDTFHFFYI